MQGGQTQQGYVKMPDSKLGHVVAAICCRAYYKPGIPFSAVGGAGGHLPSVTIEYCGVEIEADAQIGKDAVPSLTKALWNFLKVVRPCSDAPAALTLSCRLMSHLVSEHSRERKPSKCLC